MKVKKSRMIMVHQQRTHHPRMLSKIEVEQIMALHSQGVPTKRIALQMGLSRTTVRAYLNNPKKTQTPTHSGTTFLQEHAADIRELFLECQGHCVPLQRLIEAKFNVTIGLRQLQRYCQPLRKEIKASKANTRYETAPGQQMQIDFGEQVISLDGSVCRIHFFVAILGYSRRIFVKAYPAENQATWFDGIESAFQYFGGCPLSMLSDNSRCLVTEHRRLGELKLTAGYLNFCHYWKVKPVVSSPYYPQSKGKVERAVRYIKENALIGVKFVSFSQINQWLEKWCRSYSDQRELDAFVTGLRTPKERFLLEKKHLRELNQTRIAYVREETRKVDAAGLIRVDNEFYRLPNDLINKEVQILMDDHTIVVSRKGNFIIELDKARSVYRPQQQKCEIRQPQALKSLDPTYAVNPLQRPLSDYSKVTGVW